MLQRPQPAQSSSPRCPAQTQGTADCYDASQGCWGKARKPEARTLGYYEPTFLFQAIFCTGWGPSSSSGKQRKPVIPPPTLLGPFSGLDVKAEHLHRNPQQVGPGMKVISWACSSRAGPPPFHRDLDLLQWAWLLAPGKLLSEPSMGFVPQATPVVFHSVGKCSPLYPMWLISSCSGTIKMQENSMNIIDK